MPRPKLATRTLFDQLVDITYDYFGPAADRYITRQIESHLGKEPQDIRAQDLPELINWVEIATNHLIDDQKVVEEYIKRLQRLRSAS